MSQQFGPVMFPGEVEAIATVKALGAEYGYGNLIMRLSEAWSEHLQAQGIDKLGADYGGRLICVWCDTDCRTGKKVKRPTTSRKRKAAASDEGGVRGIPELPSAPKGGDK